MFYCLSPVKRRLLEWSKNRTLPSIFIIFCLAFFRGYLQTEYTCQSLHMKDFSSHDNLRKSLKILFQGWWLAATARDMSTVFWFFLVRILPHWTEYGEIIRIFRYPVRMRENGDQNNSKYEHILRSELFLGFVLSFLIFEWKILNNTVWKK